jgi:sugar lactone lactonase YvrE
MKNLRAAGFAALLLIALEARAQSIVTVAGGGSDDGHAATDVALYGVAGLAVDNAGNLYMAEFYANLVRKVGPDGTITTVAGNGGSGFGGDGGRAVKATLQKPSAVVLDSNGDIYIADSFNNRIRRVEAATGLISTFAGLGKDRPDGTIGDGGPATDAVLNGPFALWIDRGNLYVTEDGYNGNRIRRISLATRTITTIAGPADGTSGDVGDGGPAAAAKFNGPQGLAVDSAGNIYISDTYNNRVRRIDALTGNIDTYLGGGTKADDAAEGAAAREASIQYPEALAFDKDGNLIAAVEGRVWRVDKITRVIHTVTTEAGLSIGIALAKNGDLYIGDGFSVVRRYAPGVTEGVLVAGGGYYVGDGLPATAAVVRSPEGLAVDANGNLFFADFGNALVRRVDAKTGIVTTYAGNGGYYDNDPDGRPATQSPVGAPSDIAFDPQGNLYIADIVNERVKRVDKNTGILTFYAGGGNPPGANDGLPATAAKFSDLVGISFDRSGNLYIADQTANKVWRVDAATRVITTFAGVGGDPGFSGDGGPATAAKLGYPNRAVADSAGNVYISDYYNNRIRKVSSGGIITTIAGGNFPFDPPFGDGGPASAAPVSPVHMAVDARNDDLYVMDDYTSRLRKIDARTGIISTVAGSGTAYYIDADFSGDNGPAKDAKMNFPFTFSGVAVDGSGNLFIADTNNNRVRAVFACVAVTAPQLTNPANPGTAPLLSWSDVTGAFRYDVRLDTNNPPVRLIASDLKETSFTPTLSPNTRYFWSVTAKGDPFCPTQSSATSSVASFTTAAGCGVGAFDLVAPADNATGTIPNLQWQPAAGASTYDLYLGTTNPPPLFETGLTATTHSVPALPGRLFWFVVAHAACDPTKTATSSIRSFTTFSAPPCGAGAAVSTTSPASGSTNVATDAQLAWTVTQVNSTVSVFFGTTSDPPLLRSGIPAATTTLALPALDPGVTYYWKVVADCSTSISTPVASFTTRSVCTAPGATQIIFAPAAVSTGSTYTIVWSAASGLDVDGGYLVERSTSASFTPVLDSQVTSSTAASFVAGAPGTVYHRVRALPACDPTKSGPPSDVKSVTISAAASNIIFTVQPQAVVTSLNEKIEDRRSTFTLENIGTTPAQVILGEAELPGSRPFFSIAEGGAFLTLQPRTPRTFTIQYSGPPNNVSGSFQGVIFATAVGAGGPLAVTPYAFVNLKIGGSPAVAPQFVIDGTPGDYAAFPAFSGDDDSNRPGRDITIRNSGTSPMELAAEVGPDVWLIPESSWNSQPLAAGASRTFKLFTRRPFAASGSPLPRYTYFTVRTKDGASSRLLVQDNDRIAISGGRSSALDVSARSFIVADAVNRLRLTNTGGDSVQVELIFTPAGADGFDPSAVKRAVVVVPPNDVVTFVDPVGQLFGATGTPGQIEVRVPRERLGLIAVSAGIPVVTRGEGARIANPHVIYLPPAPGVPLSLTLAETSGVDKATVRVVSDTGQTIAQDIPRYGMKRFAINSATRIDINVDAGGGSVIGLANLGSAAIVSRPQTDRSGATALARALAKVAPQAGTPSVTTVVPVISGTSSAGNAPAYKTSIGLAAQGSQVVFNTSFYPSGGGAALVRPVTVNAGATAVFSDVLKELFATTPSDGNLFVVAPSNGKVYAVLQSTSPSGSSTPASALPLPTTFSEALTSAASAAQRPLFLDGLEQSTDSSRGTRWLLLLNEVAGATGFVNVRLYEAGNRSRPIAEKDFQIVPNQQLKLDTVFSNLGLDSADRRKDRTNVELVVTATAGSAKVAASAMSIDNQTGDTKMYPLAPVVGSGNPNVNFAAPVVNEQPPAAPTRHRGVKH